MSPYQREILNHIKSELDYVLETSKDLTFDQFIDSETLKRAFTRSLEIMGEAAKRIDHDFRAEHSQIEWKNMAGLRDKLIHEYFGVDYHIVWDVIKNYLPEQQFQINKLLKH